MEQIFLLIWWRVIKQLNYKIMKAKLIAFYLDYVNNFLSIEGYADYLHMSEDEVLIILDAGEKLNEL